MEISTLAMVWGIKTFGITIKIIAKYNMKNLFRAALMIVFLQLSFLAKAQLTNEINPGLINKKWSAQWIKHPANNNQYGVYHFRKSFELGKVPAKFIIHISADNRYWLFVNGKRICTGPAKGDLAHWRFESLDIAPYLYKGKNVLAATVYNFGDYRAAWQITGGTGLVVQGNNETEAVVNTNESWKVAEDNSYLPLNEIHKFIGAREVFFAARHPFGWELPEGDENGFVNAVFSEEAIPAGAGVVSPRKLVKRDIPLPEETPQRFAKVRKAEGLTISNGFIKGIGDLTVNPWSEVKLLIDQQYLTTAYPELRFSGGKGGKITLTYMEAPFIGQPYEKGNRNEVDGKVVIGIADEIYPDGDKNLVYRPLFYRTFRYVELNIQTYTEPLTIHDFSSKFTGYPFQENATFNSSDPSLQQIWQTGWRTARLCAYDTYMDCPYYEQLQYVGDTRIQALISLYVSGDDRLMKNAINQFADSRIPEGLTQSRYPNIHRQIIPPFSLFWTLMVHDFWMHRQDDAFVKQHLKGMLEVLEWHKSKIDPKTGMLGALPYWNFVDWPDEWPWVGYDEDSGLPKGSRNGNSTIHTLQFAYALDKVTEIFDAFGMKKEAAAYRKTAEQLKASTYHLCWDKEKQMMADLPDKKEFSQHANVLTVLAGALQKESASDLMQRTVADKNIIQCTVYYRFYLNQAMKKAGLGDKYLEMLTPWHDMLAIGLTTFAEKPEPSRSDCHAWSASPNYDLLATVLGVTPSSPGFKTVSIAPHPGNLEYVEGQIPCPQGLIKVSLKKLTGGELEANIDLPEDLTGIFSWNGKTYKLKPGNQLIKTKNQKP